MAEEVEYEEDDSISNFFMTSSYIQFYCDADLNSTDTFENETTTSKIKGMFDTLEDWGKEIQFITNSLTGNVNGEVNAFTNFITGGVDFLGGKIQDVLGGSFSTVGGVLNKFLTLGSKNDINLRIPNKIIGHIVYLNLSFISKEFIIHHE